MNTPTSPVAAETRPEPSGGQIITFYSYKGGVGRTMALANVATLLTQRGHRVLAIDFDLEAPGLHRYFLNGAGSGTEDRFIAPAEPAGVIELFTAVRDAITARFPTLEDYDVDPAATRTELIAIVRAQLNDSRYRYQVRLRDPNQRPPRTAETLLDFMPAGHFDDSFAKRVHDFDWQGLYRDYAEIFECLADELRARYDYILIDSRTGISDMGSICTVLLPDKLVLCFTTNEQSLYGALEVGKKAALQRKSMPGAKPLGLFPLPGRIENAEQELQREFLADAETRFGAVLQQIDPSTTEHDLSTYFSVIRVPHVSYYAYGEKIDAERNKIETSGTLAKIYAQFLESLVGFTSIESVSLSDFQKLTVLAEKVNRMAAQLYANFKKMNPQSVDELSGEFHVPELESLLAFTLAVKTAAAGQEMEARALLTLGIQRQGQLNVEPVKILQRKGFILGYVAASPEQQRRLRQFWDRDLLINLGPFPSESELAEAAVADKSSPAK